jgi:hypothetical protein
MQLEGKTIDPKEWVWRIGIGMGSPWSAIMEI